jgi:two-component system cell cycle response regulator
MVSMTSGSAEHGAGKPEAATPGAAEGDKRQDRRRRTLKQGKILLSEWTTMDCMIRDLSSGGAHLRFEGPTSLPPSFRLLITQDRTILPVDLLWQRGLSAGVAITGPAQPAPGK